MEFAKGYRKEREKKEIKLQGREIRFGRVERDIPGRHPALHPALALPVYERQAGDGNLRGAVGPDGPQPEPDPFGGRQSLDPLELSVLLGESYTIRRQRDQPELLVAFRPFFFAF